MQLHNIPLCPIDLMHERLIITIVMFYLYSMVLDSSINLVWVFAVRNSNVIQTNVL